MRQQILYTTGIDVNKELHLAKWMKKVQGELNRRFAQEVIGEWDNSYEGDYTAFIKEHVFLKWLEYTRGN